MVHLYAIKPGLFLQHVKVYLLHKAFFCMIQSQNLTQKENRYFAIKKVLLSKMGFVTLHLWYTGEVATTQKSKLQVTPPMQFARHWNHAIKV